MPTPEGAYQAPWAQDGQETLSWTSEWTARNHAWVLIEAIEEFNFGTKIKE